MQGIYLKPLHLPYLLPYIKEILTTIINEWVNKMALTLQSGVNGFILFKSEQVQIGRTERVTFCDL